MGNFDSIRRVSQVLISNSKKNPRRMAKSSLRPYYIPDGIDIEEIIASSLREKKKKKEKINGFWFFLTLRKHQLKYDEEFDLSRADFLSKINLEWRGLSTNERERYKSIAKGEPQHRGLMLPNPIMQSLSEDPYAEENEEKIDEVRSLLEEVASNLQEEGSTLKEVASMAKGLLSSGCFKQISEIKEEVFCLTKKLEKLISLLY